MSKWWLPLSLVLILSTAIAEGKHGKLPPPKDWMRDVFGCTASPCVIYVSKGGIIGRFENAAEQALKEHTQVRIKGECSSSCAMFASKVRENVCLVRGKAWMGVHMGFTKHVYGPDGKEIFPNLTTGKKVAIFENPPKGYTQTGEYVYLDYGDDINGWAAFNYKMPATPEVYPLTWDEAMQFWKPCPE